MSSLREIPGSDVRLDRVGALSPAEILVDVDGPRLFLSHTSEGEDLLVYHCAEEPDRLDWLAVPTDAHLVDLVRAGQVPLLDVLRQPWAWIVTQAIDGTIERVRRVHTGDLPPGALPAPGVTLVSPEKPFLAVRATGSAISAHEVPASVVRKVIDGAMHAMKTLVEHALSMTTPEGRPTDRLRRYYDLPTRHLSFGSFEAVFGEPTAPIERPLLPDEREALDRAASLLQRGIAEVQRAPEEGETFVPDEDLGTALDALSGLLPPASGLIEEVHLSGRLIGAVTVRLAREHGARARRMLRQTRPAVQSVVVEGTIRELDKDTMTFVVRSADRSEAWSCRFSSAQRDDVYTAFSEDYPIAVSGHLRAGKADIDVLTIEPLR